MKKIKLKKPKMKVYKKIKNKCDEQIKQKGLKKFIWTIILTLLIIITSCCLIFALFIIITSPEFDQEELYSKEATVLYDVNGKEFARIGQENRALITYEDLPQVFLDALIATEDSRFFQHNGLDIARFLKASFKQLTGSNEGGASTISMQLIKKTYTSSEASGIKGIIRKFTDIYMAVFKLENCYTKEEIIEFYANSLWFGHDGNLNYSGIYGVEQASQYFFGKSVSDLTLAESSLLVGMYQNPVLYNPYRNPEGCRNRQRTVLKLMVTHGYITEEEKDAALNISIESLLKDDTTNATATNSYQASIDYIIDDVIEKTGKDPREESMKIYTTIDISIQDSLTKLENGELFTFYNDYDQEGTAITSTEDGSIVALSGGRNYVARGLNRATDINRQPGSTAKPIFDYAPYIEYLNGGTGDYLFDEPYTYSNGQKLYDADNSYQGMITMRQSLVGSRNITALQLFQKVAAEDITLIQDLAHAFGIDYGDYLYESASIGGFNGASPLEMSAAYAVFGRGGYYIEPYSFTKIIYEDDTTYTYKYKKEKVLSEETAYMISDMLVDAVEQNWSGNVHVSGTQIAGKTGTTDVDDAALEAKGIPAGTIMDSWNITYNPEYSIALWYGYDELTKEHYMTTTTGWKARSVIMGKLASLVYSKNVTFKKPSGVVAVEVEKETVPLQLPSENTPEDMRMTELFKSGTEPTEVSSRYTTLSSPSGGTSSVSNDGTLKLTWTAAEEPDAVNTNYLQNYFNENYASFASKYYEKRIEYNTNYIGNFGYDVYLKDSSGNLNKITWVATNSYTQSIDPTQNYTFVIKSAYSIYKNNASSGITITVNGNSNASNSTTNETTNTTTNTTTVDDNSLD